MKNGEADKLEKLAMNLADKAAASGTAVEAIRYAIAARNIAEMIPVVYPTKK